MSARGSIAANAWILLLVLMSAAVLPAQAEGEEGIIPFDAERWTLLNAEVTEFLGRPALMGRASLNDVVLKNGVIEFDIAVPDVRQRSYPGIFFRVQSMRDYERFYVRPHRAPLYPDALQYVPSINGISGWQLYAGDGYSALGEIPENEWFHVKIEVAGSQARFWIGDAERPALVVPELKHGVSAGGITLDSQRNGTAYFSNFRFTADEELKLPAPPANEMAPGILADWELSQAFPAGRIDTEQPLGGLRPEEIQWQKAQCEPNGLFDVARLTGRTGRAPDYILARTTLHADQPQVKKLKFGYSDDITIFLNGRILFNAGSAYRQRDPSFLGVVGLNDVIYLPLEQGENDLHFLLGEVFGGWGFIFQDAGAVFEHPAVTRDWEATERFLMPETALYDPARQAIYVSNFDGYNFSTAEGMQSISRLSADGRVEQADWAGGLFNPTGMALVGDRLFVVERAGVAEIDAASGETMTRHPIPMRAFLNDIAADAEGNLYVSDSTRGVILRKSGDAFEEWLSGPEVVQPNGLHAAAGTLYVGTNGDRKLKAVDLESKEVRVLAALGPGVIDGIEPGPGGDLLVSQAEGKLYRVSPSGEVTRLLDTSVTGQYCANFAYVPELGRIVVPTLVDNRVVAYRLEFR